MQAEAFLPPELRGIFMKLPPAVRETTEEIRLRAEMPVCLMLHGGAYYLSPEGALTQNPQQAFIAEKALLRQMLMIISQSSFYALEEELRRGYITLPGGHRAGLCGHALLDRGVLRGQRDIASIDLRVAREVRGCAAPLLQRLMSGSRLPPHTLIISPPGCGKTTLLRDLAVGLSDQYDLQVGIVDERSEIAAFGNGMAQLYVGRNSDVLDGCPKAEGMMLMLRSMSPQVLICDEIGRREDMEAIAEVINGGVRIIASAHAGNIHELLARPFMGELLRQHCFERVALLSRRNGPCTLESLVNIGE